jgi:DNA-binding protein H-NS
MANSLSDLIAQKAALERQIQAARATEKAEAIARIRTLMAEHGLTVSDLNSTPRRSGASSGSKVAPKYKDPVSGATWSGRGLKPKWLAAAMAVGKSPDDFAL